MFVDTLNNKILRIISQREQWGAIIKQFEKVDFYHTYDYHEISKNEGEQSILVYFNDGDTHIALPLLLRPIEDSIYFDATSVYGYAGPLIKNIPENYDFTRFQRHFIAFCKEYRIVSVFSRLNPYINHQEACLEGLGHIENAGKTVYINLNQSLTEQKAQYSKRLKTYINKARKKYILKIGKNLKDLDVFISIYYENMDRVNATSRYYFSREYFEKIFQSSSFKNTLLLAIDEETGETASASFFVEYGSFVQYHLSGTKVNFLDLNPTKLLIDEMRLLSKERGYTTFNLGGGLGGAEDSLFYFKSSFSKHAAPFKIWKYKVNPDVYNDLSQKKLVAGKTEEMNSFFPIYRSI